MSDTDCKVCSKCRATKSISEFTPTRKGYAGTQTKHCASCRKTSSAWTSAFSKAIRAYANRPSLSVADILATPSAGWCQREFQVRVSQRVCDARTRARELHAVPVWADHAAIRGVYEEMAKRRAAGEDVHVDHIVPLSHPLVCGLHVEHNLQIIPAKQNATKSNIFAETWD